MITGLSVGRYLNTLLSRALGVKVFPLVADLDSKLPLVVYKRTNLEEERDKDGLIYDIASVEIYCLADSYDRSIELAERAREALKETDDRVEEIRLVGASEGVDETVWYQIIEIEIWLQKE